MSNKVSLFAAKCRNKRSLELAELKGDFPKTMFSKQIPNDHMSTLSALYVSISLWSNSSGAMYLSEPTSKSVQYFSSVAKPKSVSLMDQSSQIKMFSGLMSR
ncbi:hypothetical protein OGATHE_000942 [Ogataea polymorpha]|uniref:Uncharacterized protein n=1 Tax=Ogataea polymorpha TaxID=460523 RepID=A0A9P8PSE5_9ASCO|nr:hypothetical protein OGATHE_000942 [Ogataea polymorpha]